MTYNPDEFSFFAIFTNNGYANGFRAAIAYSRLPVKEIELDTHSQNKKNIIPIISYDLKNSFEDLISKNKTEYQINDLVLIEPETFVFVEQTEIDNLLKPGKEINSVPVNIEAKVTKQEYLKAVNSLKDHIQQGDIYEVNYCIEFFAKDISIDAFELFKQYNALSLSPMSCYLKYNDLHILCGSPERFLKRNGNTITSEPIKGTRKRSDNDAAMIAELENDQKERAENIMIVDLVRNDLSKVANKGSVRVDELCKVHTFATIHQSISGISCEVPEKTDFKTLLQALFPMGSMTGAPKISAMKLIDETENSKRQVYSGSTGYVLPNGDMDLNVIIRTMIYDKKNKYLSFMVGSAITAASDPEKEYAECLIKAASMIKALNGKLE